jgi:hypothetical protein
MATGGRVIDAGTPASGARDWWGRRTNCGPTSTRQVLPQQAHGRNPLYAEHFAGIRAMVIDNSRLVTTTALGFLKIQIVVHGRWFPVPGP